MRLNPILAFPTTRTAPRAAIPVLFGFITRRLAGIVRSVLPFSREELLDDGRGIATRASQA